METFDDKLRRVLSEPIAVVDYDPSWPSVFAAEAARLSHFFPPGAIRAVEHIGSTAVPGLAAKPIVDILVFVDDLQLVVERVAPALEAAGYDFFLRPAFGDSGPRYPWFIGRDAAGRRVSHIHIGRAGDGSWSDRMLFRDWLRTHPDVARAYGDLKRELAARFPGDREAYTLAKTDFILGEIAAAKVDAGIGAAGMGPQGVIDPPVVIRPAGTGDIGVLRSALAHAIQWRLPALSASPEEVIRITGHEYLLDGWGRDGDVGMVADAGSRLVGAAWYRVWDDAQHSYGYVDEATPEIAIGVDPAFRGRGVGTALLVALLEAARDRGVARLSLSVEGDNSAVGLYQRLGFIRYVLVDASWTMIRVLHE